MSALERLPTQHPQHPHCPSCNADLPSFAGVSMMVAEPELKGAKLLGITFRVRCACGAEWNMHKAVR